VNERARETLQELARQAIASDLDQIAGELHTIRAALSKAGIPLPAVPADERRRTVVKLRAAGLSSGLIAQGFGVHRGTIVRDVRELGLPPAQRSTGVDGYTRTYHRPVGTSELPES
jgi:hypothetical protein